MRGQRCLWQVQAHCKGLARGLALHSNLRAARIFKLKPLAPSRDFYQIDGGDDETGLNQCKAGGPDRSGSQKKIKQGQTNAFHLPKA